MNKIAWKSDRRERECMVSIFHIVRGGGCENC